MTRLSSVDTQFDFTLQTQRAAEEVAAEPPFRVLLVGDFTGRASRGAGQPQQIAQRRPVPVDRDNLDAVLARWGVELALAEIAGAHEPGRATVRFDSLASFHPDALVDRLAMFAAAAQLAGEGRGRTERSPAQAPPRAPESAALLEQIIGGGGGASLPQSEDDWQRYVQAIVGPYLVAAPDAAAERRTAEVDAIRARMLRDVLHAPHFQELEAAWRGVDWLVRRLPTDAALKVYLFDATRDELAADLAGDDLSASGLYRQLVQQAVGTPGGQPWAVVAGLYEFGPTLADIELLGRLVLIAACAGAPWLSGASLALAGCASPADADEPRQWREPLAADARQLWRAIRALPEAAYLGLALPRWLVRLPYGPRTEPIDRFAFEEIADHPKDADFLWGPPAIVLAALLAEAFVEDGWSLRPGSVGEIGDLPLFTYDELGERVARACTSAPFSERAAEALLERGLMPLLALRGQDVIRLARFQSIAEPLRPLAGRWGAG